MVFFSHKSARVNLKWFPRLSPCQMDEWPSSNVFGRFRRIKIKTSKLIGRSKEDLNPWSIWHNHGATFDHMNYHLIKRKDSSQLDIYIHNASVNHHFKCQTDYSETALTCYPSYISQIKHILHLSRAWPLLYISTVMHKV